MPRQAALDALARVLENAAPLDEALAGALSRERFAAMPVRDRAFTRLLVATVLRRHGELGAVLDSFLAKPLPQKLMRARVNLILGAAQLLLLETPPHAAISLAVDLTRQDPRTRHLDGLTNAVLRAVAREGQERLAALDGVALDIPPWLMRRWSATYGAARARRIAEASLREPALDLTVKSDPARWAEVLGGIVLSSGSVRLSGGGAIGTLVGFDEGAWWVQDAAAALPARLFGDLRGRSVADLCAAPGGKTLQLAAAGARATAVDMRPERLALVRENLARVSLEADCVAADATAWSPGRLFDAVLLDAPCTATGTIRRHPDILHLKKPDGFAATTVLQRNLLEKAQSLVAPGGMLVYCTCSLEPEEGEEQVEAFLRQHPAFSRVPIRAAEIGVGEDAITAAGDLRTLPFQCLGDEPEAAGLDGFFAARLKRSPGAGA